MFKIIVLLQLLLGAGLFVYSLKLPYYTDADAKYDLDIRVGIDELQTKYYKQNYYKEVAKLRTSKLQLEDLGSGLSVLSLLILLVLFIWNINSFKDLKKLPYLNSMSILIWGAITWLLLIPGNYWYYIYRLRRGDYPWFADTIFIPIMQNSIAILLYFLFMMLILWVLTLFYRTPESILTTANKYGKRIILTEAFYALLIVFCGWAMYLLLLDGDHFAIIVNLFYIYLLLILRAGSLAHINHVQSYSTRF